MVDYNTSTKLIETMFRQNKLKRSSETHFAVYGRNYYILVSVLLIDLADDKLLTSLQTVNVLMLLDIVMYNNVVIFVENK